MIIIGVSYFRDIEIPEIEIKTCSGSVHASKKHVHEELSIGLVEKGISVFENEDRTFVVGPRHLVIIPPEMIHKCSPRNYENWQFKMLYIQQAWIKKAFGLHTLDYVPTVKRLDEKSLKQILNLFRILLSKLSRIQKETCLIRDLPGILNLDNFTEEDSELYDSHNSKAFRTSREYLHDNYLENITLDNLAVVSGVSKFYLIRLFNKTCGISPHGYLMMLRINYARKELRKDMSIAEIAAGVGFYDQSHFSKVFKQFIGTTPDYYRRS
ncbi:MAG: AraC family transcriptional regulator [Desulfosporosinus sp.]|nr:AraC family transcriptional regulator [Desulfosporosinus sp.]